MIATRSGWSLHVLALALACGSMVWLGGGAVAPAVAGTVTVDVLAPRQARLAEDLRRELSASGFVVVFVESTGLDWQGDVRRLPGTQARQGVVVRADGQLMTVFTRQAGSDTVQSHFEQRVDSQDRLARRRACLGVVESLRFITQSGAPSGAAASGAEPPRPAAPAAVGSRHVGAPSTPGAAVTPHSPVLPPASSRSPARPEASPAPPPGPAAAPAHSPDAPPVAGAPPSPPPMRPPVQGQRAPVLDSAGHAPSPVPSALPAAARALPGAEPAAPELDGRPHRPWQVGVGSTLGLEAAPGGPTGHLQFLGYLPLEWRLAVCVRALWPVLAGQFRSGGNDVRTWSFGGVVSAQYLLDFGPARLRPFLGAALGSRVALTETTPMNALQSRETFTPSMTLGAEAGVRYALGGRVQLFLELGVGRGWLIPGVHRVDYEETAANAAALRSSFGVMFEI